MESKHTSLTLKFLYTTLPGRVVLKILINPLISEIGGLYMSCPLSKMYINRFIKNNNINMQEYIPEKYRCFNDFFTRRIRPDARSVDIRADRLIAPCDGRLSIYKINEKSVIGIKGSRYSISDLVENEYLAKQYSNGICLVFRLCVDDYHRYCYVDNGEKSDNIYIKGKLHTVQPIAVRRYPVYVQNSREYTVIKSDNFGKVTQIEVGAMMVGKIHNHHGAGKIKRGQEKGMFLFGGSTIVMLLQENKVVIDNDLLAKTGKGSEAVVRMGQKIGKKY